MGKKLCLCMIVKDEAAILRETLEHFSDFVDTMVVVDTGSTDDTIAIAKSKGAHVQAVPWKGFGASRTRAMDIAKEHCRKLGLDLANTWLLIADADDRIEGLSALMFRTALDALHPADAYDLTIELAELRWTRPQLLRASAPWSYRGVLHEYVDSTAPLSRQLFVGPRYVASHRGSRSNDPQKYARDAEVLEKAFADESDEGLRARYAFYCAQSHRDAGNIPLARHWYQIRFSLGSGYSAERWHAALCLGRLFLAQDEPQSVHWYMRAWELDPIRAEPLVDLARHYRLTHRPAMALMHALAASTLPVASGLFVEEEIYRWQALDEVACAYFNLGQYGRCLQIYHDLRIAGRLPATEDARVKSNEQEAIRRLG